MGSNWVFLFLIMNIAGAQTPPPGQARPDDTGGGTVLSIAEAIREAVDNNLGILAERANLPVAEAARITARLRPNPVVSAGADSLDLLGTGFSPENAAGPPQYSIRVDLPLE